jgi:hypothetical protein
MLKRDTCELAWQSASQITIERQMHKAIERLKRLQSKRKREPTPAPIIENVSEN